jgi:hypothetical protein
MVLHCGEVPPKRAVLELKAWSTRRLRLSDLVSADRQVWTERGSGRYLWDEGSVKAAAEYVVDGQGKDLD